MDEALFLSIQKSKDKPWTLVHGKTQRLFDDNWYSKELEDKLKQAFSRESGKSIS